MKRIIRTSVILACCIAFMAGTSRAIPSFARKYGMSCRNCHEPVPVLNKFGTEFAANGYQLPGLEQPQSSHDTGDELLSLMDDLPLAVRLDGFARYQPGNEVATDMQWPFLLKILSSGQISKNISYFFYFLFSERGEIAGVEDAFVYFNNIGEIPLDAVIGQFQVADPVFKRETRPTFEDYEIYTIRPGKTKADLAYDRGFSLSYTLPSGTELGLSVINGNGIGIGSAGQTFDSDSYKNFFFRIAQPVDSVVRIGALGYAGKERDAGVNSIIQMLGGDASFSFGRFALSGQYLYRRDTNPFFVSGKDSSMAASGGFAQITYAPEMEASRWYLFFLYNRIESDIEDLRYHSVAGNFSYLLARNFKISAEYAYDILRDRHKFTVGFMTAF